MRTTILMIAGAVFGGLESPFFAVIGATLGFLIARSTRTPVLPSDRSYCRTSSSAHFLDPLHTQVFCDDDDWQLDSSYDRPKAPQQFDTDLRSPFSNDSGLLTDRVSDLAVFDDMGSSINPATGLPMMGDMEAGFDVGGNLYGMGIDDAFNSSSFDDDPMR
ncbi:hypothetical protein [Marinobacter shengliensis]|uniref:Uncharacterized protein n=1 Tax=Marinobacter shengliensis TaxID=1389223 RepID=A0ABV4WC91_9GAMM